MDAVIIPNLLMQKLGNEKLPAHMQVTEIGFEFKQFEFRIPATNFCSVSILHSRCSKSIAEVKEWRKE